MFSLNFISHYTETSFLTGSLPSFSAKLGKPRIAFMRSKKKLSWAAPILLVVPVCPRFIITHPPLPSTICCVIGAANQMSSSCSESLVSILALSRIHNIDQLNRLSVRSLTVHPRILVTATKAYLKQKASTDFCLGVIIGMLR